MVLGFTKFYKKHPFYIFFKGVAAGVVGISGLVTFLHANDIISLRIGNEDYIQKVEALSYLKEQGYKVFEDAEYKKSIDKCKLQECQLNKFHNSMEKQTILERNNSKFFQGVVTISLNKTRALKEGYASNDYSIHYPFTQDTSQDTNPYVQCVNLDKQCIAFGYIHILDANYSIDEPINGSKGDSFNKGDYKIIIQNVTDGSATYEVYNKSVTQLKCDLEYLGNPNDN